MTISAKERRVLDDIPLDQAWSLVETFSTMHRWLPEDVNRSADVIIARARALGLPVEVFEPHIHLSIPLEASVAIAGQSYRAKPPSLSQPVPEGLTGPALYVKANEENLRSYSRDIRELFGDSFRDWADFKARVKGRIVVTEGFGNPALTSLVHEAGGLGLVVSNPGANIHWGTSSGVWGSPGLADLGRLPAIPVLAVNRPDGEAIKAAIRGEAEITVRSRLQVGWFPQKIPVVTIPAAGPEAERFVLVHGHYDSWEVGVGDNATGDATLLALAAALWKHRGELRRSVRVAWWPGHSTGRYAGSTWYADNFALDLDRNCVAVVNCDSPGCRWATSYHKTTGMAELHGFVTEVITDVDGKPPAFIRPKRAGDASFMNIGISSYYSLSSTMPDDLRAEKGYYEVSGCGGNIAWHTEDDTLEIADREILAKDLDIYTLSVLRHASAEHLPVDWRATLAEFRRTLARYREAAGDRLDWTEAERATRELDAALARFDEAAAAGRLPAPEANDVRMRLQRLLIPLNFTRTQRFAQDPAMTCPALPGMAAALELPQASGDTAHAIVTEVRRGANLYAATLDQAREIVERAL